MNSVPDLDMDVAGLSFEDDEADQQLAALLGRYRSGSSGSGGSAASSVDAQEQAHQQALAQALEDTGPVPVVESAHEPMADVIEEAEVAGTEHLGDASVDDEAEDPAQNDHAGSTTSSEDSSEDVISEEDQAASEAAAVAQRLAVTDSQLLPVQKYQLHSEDGSSEQLVVRQMPQVMMTALREAVEEGAVSCGYGKHEAHAFAQKLSQAALVTALLCAKLHVSEFSDEKLDRSTAQAVRFFRRTDPLQASLVKALTALTERETVRDRRLNRLETAQREVVAGVNTMTFMQSFAMVDKQENLLRGLHTSADIDVTEHRVVALRDRSHRRVQDHVKAEKDRAGRQR